MSSLPPSKMVGLDEGVAAEIFSYLPLKSLFRCRAVCKLWRDIIDSPFLRKLHIDTHTRSSYSYSYKEEDEDDEKVYLHLIYDEFNECLDNYKLDVKVSIKVVEKGKSVDLNLGFPSAMKMFRDDAKRFMGPVKGLICFNLRIEKFAQPIAICNPFLGQIKILPFSPILASPDPSCDPSIREVGIGCDGEFYKVVELVYCRNHDGAHAHLYSRRTDSWRKLGDLPDLIIFRPIMLSCSDGHFAHWYAENDFGDSMLLTFDMKNEVFSTIKMSVIASIPWSTHMQDIIARDENSFIVIIPPRNRSDKLVRIYDSSICEENGIRMISWNHVVDLEKPVVQTLSTPLPLWRRDCVMFKFFDGEGGMKVLFYDYAARRFIGFLELPFYSNLFCYKGTFISP